MSSETARTFYGAVEAVVVDVNDPEKEGRVKLQFPWFDKNAVTDWCRVAQFYAGPESGAFFVPEVNAEVLVNFIHGDMRQPVVVGCLYNGVDKPATFRDKSKDEKQLLTKSGHRITVVDTEGEEKIVVVDKSKKQRIGINTKDKSIKIESKGGTLSLNAKDIEIKAENALTVDAKSIQGKASASLKTQAGSIEAKASGAVNLKGSVINLN